MSATIPHTSVETNAGTITSWLPLTTAWPQVSGCSSAIYSTEGGLLVGWDPSFVASIVQDSTACLPLEVTTWWDQPPNSITVTSLGPLVCPDAYDTATMFPTTSGSTLIACCPSSYTFKGMQSVVHIFGQCQSPVTSGQLLTFYTSLSSSTGFQITTTTMHTIGASVFALPINGYIFTSSSFSPAANTGSSVTTIAASSSSPAIPAIPADPAAKSSTLSIGAIAGIAVSAVVVLIALAAALWILCRHRKRSAISNNKNQNSGENPTYYLHSQDHQKQQPMYEADGDDNSKMLGVPVYEMNGQLRRAELSS